MQLLAPLAACFKQTFSALRTTSQTTAVSLRCRSTTARCSAAAVVSCILRTSTTLSRKPTADSSPSHLYFLHRQLTLQFRNPVPLLHLPAARSATQMHLVPSATLHSTHRHHTHLLQLLFGCLRLSLAFGRSALTRLLRIQSHAGVNGRADSESANLIFRLPDERQFAPQLTDIGGIGFQHRGHLVLPLGLHQLSLGVARGLLNKARCGRGTAPFVLSPTRRASFCSPRLGCAE